MLREDEFSPLKNGLDCKKENALTCKQDLYAQHVRWLRRAGALFDSDIEPTIDEDKNNNLPEIEISPMVSYNGEGLQELVAGKMLASPLYIYKDSKNNEIVFMNEF